MGLTDEIKKIESRMSKAEAWFEENAEIDPAYWERCFDAFCSLLRERARLYLLEQPKQIEML